MKTFSIKIAAFCCALCLSFQAHASIFDYHAAYQIMNDLSHLTKLNCEFPTEFYTGVRDFQCTDKVGNIAYVNLQLGGSSPAINNLVRMTVNFSADINLENLEVFKQAIAASGLELFNANPNMGAETVWDGKIYDSGKGTLSPGYANPKWQSYRGFLDFSITPRQFNIWAYYAG